MYIPLASRQNPAKKYEEVGKGKPQRANAGCQHKRNQRAEYRAGPDFDKGARVGIHIRARKDRGYQTIC